MTTSTKQLAADKLAESGLTLDDAAQLGITWHDNLKDLHESFDQVPGLRFEYRDPVGAPMEARPGWGLYWRVRKLETPAEDKKGFDKQTGPAPTHTPEGKKLKPKGMPKYSQPPNSGVSVYFPSNYDDWLDTMLDPEVSIIITEGELKAAKACKEGIPTIGLGGVNSYKSAAQGYLFLPALEHVVWAQRKVYIVFDSDLRENENVANAVNGLGEQLYLRGAIPHCVFLPTLEGAEKTGLDDYIVSEGIEAVRQLCVDCADHLMLTKAAWQWNEENYHIRSPNCVVDRRTGEITKQKEYVEANRELNYPKRTLDSEGKPTITMVALASEIFTWPLHSKLDKFVYEPQHPPLAKIEGESAFNVWKGWGVQPVKGDIGMYQELMDHLFGDSANEAKWYKAWIAYQLQNPGIKLKTAVLMIGAHGAGKSMLGEIMQPIFGENYREVDIESFFSQFNEWAARSQFILANEVIVKGDEDRRKHASALKNYITRKKVTVNEKFGLKYDIADRCNIYMTANPMDSLPLENGERRYFIFKSKAGRLQKEWLDRWDKWKENGGVEALFYHLLHEVDTSWFDPMAAALETESRAAVLEYQQTDLEGLAADLMDNGPRVGEILLTSDLFSIDQLYITLTDDQKRYAKSHALLKRALIDRGAIKVQGGTSDGRMKYEGKLVQFYALRNFPKWGKATVEEMRKHLDDHFPSDVAKKGKF